MRFGLNVGYSGARMALNMELIKEADRLGFDSVWTAEAYGSDAITPLAWIAAQTKRLKLGSGIMQMAARTPAMTAMTATTLDQLSGGRMLVGLGVSGPQVVEGWHGVPYGKPLQRTRYGSGSDGGGRSVSAAAVGCTINCSTGQRVLFSSSVYTTYASANPACADIISRYMWVQAGWFSVRASSSGLRRRSRAA